MRKFILITLLGLLFAGSTMAQKWAVKSNLAYWGTLTPNLGTEFALGRKTTLDIIGAYNPFTLSNNRQLKMWGIQPEFRWWTCNRFAGHFFGIHAHYGDYNAGIKTYTYDGWLAGGGVSYGYNWVLGKRWNFEAEIGVGYAYMKYDRYLREKCQRFIDNSSHNYFGPTKVGLSFVYFIL